MRSLSRQLILNLISNARETKFNVKKIIFLGITRNVHVALHHFWNFRFMDEFLAFVRLFRYVQIWLVVLLSYRIFEDLVHTYVVTCDNWSIMCLNRVQFFKCSDWLSFRDLISHNLVTAIWVFTRMFIADLLVHINNPKVNLNKNDKTFHRSCFTKEILFIIYLFAFNKFYIFIYIIYIMF